MTSASKMTDSDLTFRLRHDPHPPKTLILPFSTSPSSLYTQICSTLQIPSRKSIRILSGFPPRRLEFEEGLEHIGDVLGGGETLIIEVVSNDNEGGGRENREGSGSFRNKRSGGVKKRGRRKKGAFSGVGYALTEEAVTQTKSVQENLEKKLVGSAVGGGAEGGGGSAGKSFRGALRAAREEREVEAIGEARVRAVMGKKYTIVEKEEVEDLKGGGAGEREVKFDVEFLGKVGRKWIKDEGIRKVGRDILKGVVMEMVEKVEDREKLRMREMVRESLVVFWNLVRLYDGDIEGGLKDLCPDVDWEFLRTRRRKMSEKARQAQESQRLEKSRTTRKR